MDLTKAPTRAITVRLEPADYDRLEAEAKRLGMRPATLARVLIRTGLAQPGVSSPDERGPLSPQEALKRLAAIRARLPRGQSLVDVVKLIAEGREATPVAQRW